MNAYKGGPRTQIFKGEEGGGGGGQVFPGDMEFLRLIPLETLYHMIFRGGGNGSVLAYPKMEWA